MPRPKAILIAGPTASGKSALAVALACEAGGPVVNADSMQVYAELSVLTARPTPGEMGDIPHLLYGHVSARESYSTGRWIEDVRSVLAKAEAAGRVPVIVGGTGLYFKALLHGLSPIPAVPDEVRARCRAMAAHVGARELHAELRARDPAMAARLEPTDAQRITRALEVLEATGRSLAEWQELPGAPLLDQRDTVRLVLLPEREALRARCDQRFDAMMTAGALEEARRLASLGLHPGLPAMRALGVPPLLAHVRGELAEAAAIARAKAETRQYAKRQVTWLRRNMIAWRCVDAQFTGHNLSGLLPFIRR